MRIGILTHYDVLNQGAQLQMYALYHQLLELQIEPFILTYQKSFEFERMEQLKNRISFRSVPYLMKNYLIKKGPGLTLHNIQKYRKLMNFQKKNYQFLDYSSQAIDIAIIGSDEVFSIPVGFNQMMFGYGVGARELIAYAPSFGQTDMERINAYHLKEVMKAGLLKFKALSSRDTHTGFLLKTMTGKAAQIVCDPVLLYDFGHADSYFQKPKYKYLILYSYDRHMNSKEEIQAIREFAAKKHLKIVSPGTFHKWCDVNIACDPLEWMEWFRYAEYVITDTFHGTIVAAILNINMAVYIRSGVNRNKLEDLLKQLGIEERKLEAVSFHAVNQILGKDMDFNRLKETIRQLRETGRNYLINAIHSREKDSGKECGNGEDS